MNALFLAFEWICFLFSCGTIKLQPHNICICSPPKEEKHQPPPPVHSVARSRAWIPMCHHSCFFFSCLWFVSHASIWYNSMLWYIFLINLSWPQGSQAGSQVNSQSDNKTTKSNESSKGNQCGIQVLRVLSEYKWKSEKIIYFGKKLSEWQGNMQCILNAMSPCIMKLIPFFCCCYADENEKDVHE